jgi:hypothetical protein
MIARLERWRYGGPAAPFRRDRLTVAVVGLVAVAAIGLAILPRGGVRRVTPSGNGAIQSNDSARPLSTEALIDSIGVVVHFNYTDTAYGRQQEIVQLLKTLGVRHIRDAVASPGSALARGLQAAAGQGITSTLAIGDVGRDPSQSIGDSVRVLNGAINAFEGPNELDNSGNPAWPEILRAYMPAMAVVVSQRAPGIPLIQPSLLYPASRRLVPGLAGLYNEHPYPLGGPPEPALKRAIAELPAGAIDHGVVFTETGYHNALLSTTGPPPVSEQTAAVYMPRLLVSDFAAGVRSSFIYEFVDEKPNPDLSDGEQHYGLLRNDLSPKPAFSAIRTLIAALRASPGPGLAGGRSVRVRLAAPHDVTELAMMRPDGSQVVALWRPVSVWDATRRRALAPSVEAANLTFDGGAKQIVVWRPSSSAGPVEQFAEANKLRLALGGDLVLVSFR